MLHYENNCFKIIEYNKTSITFNITGIDSNKTGSCLYFNKSIYYGQYNCIDKPENTYYVINGNENTGIIKDCDISCKSCYGESTEGNTNCIECAENYFKTEHSNTNCLKANLIPNNYYLNIIDNIYYKCHPNCKSCNGSYNNITNDMNCNLCVNNSFFLDGEMVMIRIIAIIKKCLLKLKNIIYQILIINFIIVIIHVQVVKIMNLMKQIIIVLIVIKVIIF